MFFHRSMTGMLALHPLKKCQFHFGGQLQLLEVLLLTRILFIAIISSFILITISNPCRMPN